MFPQIVPRTGPSGVKTLLSDLTGRDAGGGQGVSSLMRAIREAANSHGRNAEMAHERAIVNPKLARRDVELQLRAEELMAGRGAGGVGGRRRLRAARADGTMKPRPPKSKKSHIARMLEGGYDGPLNGGDSAIPPTHSAVTAEGDSLMYAPALQPMPRFMGAGPVANGSLLRSRVSKVSDPSDEWLHAGTV